MFARCVRFFCFAAMLLVESEGLRVLGVPLQGMTVYYSLGIPRRIRMVLWFQLLLPGIKQVFGHEPVVLKGHHQLDGSGPFIGCFGSNKSFGADRPK